MVSTAFPSRPFNRSLFALAALNFFLADARDGLGPFLDGFLATKGWNHFTLGMVATIGGVAIIAVAVFFLCRDAIAPALPGQGLEPPDDSRPGPLGAPAGVAV
jgi:hypothetical protein